MTIAAIAPAASTAKAAAAMMQVQNAYAAAAAHAAAPKAQPTQHIEMHKEIVSPQAEIVVQANATAQAQDARYDNRVTGPTENVRSFDRMALVIEGFEHLREIFENVKEQSEHDMNAMATAGVHEVLAAAGMDVRM